MPQPLDGRKLLLVQVRDPGDPMSAHELGCFARRLGVGEERIVLHDLLAEPAVGEAAGKADLVLVGGSGDHSAVRGGPWLEPALEGLRALVASGRPVFASCWGFQALARALGGEVVNDPGCSEVGTVTVQLTREGQADPVFGALPASFDAQAGHEDSVVGLPEGAVLLARSDRALQGWRLADRPVWATQFHPELTLEGFLDRMRSYPKYLREVMGMEYDELVRERMRETPEAEKLLPALVEHLFGGG